jgi:D-aspartate ligase
MEYKRDRRSGRFVIVEPTVGRTDWQEEIATLCGINVPLAAYNNELEYAFSPPSRPTLPVAWRASALQRSARNCVPPGVRVVDAAFRVTDPLPGIYHYSIDEIGTRLSARMKRLFTQGNVADAAHSPPPLA